MQITVKSYPLNEINYTIEAEKSYYSNKIVKYLWVNIAEATSDEYVEITYNGVVKTLLITDECRYTPVDIAFQNKEGALQLFTFFKAKKDTITTTSENFESNRPIGSHQFIKYRQLKNGNETQYSSFSLNNTDLGLFAVSDDGFTGMSASAYNISYSASGSGSIASYSIGSSGMSFNVGDSSNSCNFNVNSTSLFVNSPNFNFKGISGSADYSANIGPLDYTQKQYVDDKDALKADLSGATFSGDVQLTGSLSNANSAVNKGYVDNVIAGLSFKTQCVVATTSNIALSGLLTIDGITLTGEERVLVKNQTTASENGIYIANSLAWTRASDADTGSELENKTIPVTTGTINQDTWWTITNDSIILATTAITLSQTGGMGTYTNGTGIQLAGNIFSVDPSYIATAVATALSDKEPTINAGITGQYWRGDKTWQTLNKSVVGLGNVDNTSDANKPVSTAQQTAIDTKLTNGGDTTGATMYIGSNDAQQVVLKYNNSPVITIPSAAGISLPNGGSISNASASGRGTILMGTTGVGITLQRNLADAVAAATINNAHTSSTGNIIEFNSNISGATATRALVSKTGQFQGTSFKLSALNTAPSSSTDTGTTGEIRITAAYIYVCVATNTWVRSALTTW